MSAVIGDGEDFRIVLKLKRYELGLMPAVECNVEVRAAGFQGANDVWFEVEELERFLVDLQRFQESRQGSCHLCSMSPDEFRMTIEALDRTGHFCVAVDLRRYTRAGQLYRPYSLSAAWELDPTSLPRVIRDFPALLPPAT